MFSLIYKRFQLKSKQQNRRNKAKIAMREIASPWFFSFNRERVAGKNISIKSGTLLIILRAANADYNENESKRK